MSEKKTQLYPSLMTALQELKIVNAKSESQSAVDDLLPREAGRKPFDKKKAVRKLIRHLESTEE